MIFSIYAFRLICVSRQVIVLHYSGPTNVLPCQKVSQVYRRDRLIESVHNYLCQRWIAELIIIILPSLGHIRDYYWVLHIHAVTGHHRRAIQIIQNKNLTEVSISLCIH